jgi:ATP-dependent Clp protease ATP-binding subunit ClpA
LGEASVDKTGVIEGLTCVSIKQRVSSLFHRRVLVGIEAGALRSDTNYRGDLEVNMVGIVAAGDRYRDLVFFIDEIHALVGAGSRHPNILNRDEKYYQIKANGYSLNFLILKRRYERG